MKAIVKTKAKSSDHATVQVARVAKSFLKRVKSFVHCALANCKLDEPAAHATLRLGMQLVGNMEQRNQREMALGLKEVMQALTNSMPTFLRLFHTKKQQEQQEQQATSTFDVERHLREHVQAAPVTNASPCVAPVNPLQVDLGYMCNCKPSKHKKSHSKHSSRRKSRSKSSKKKNSKTSKAKSKSKPSKRKNRINSKTSKSKSKSKSRSKSSKKLQKKQSKKSKR